MKGIYTAEKAQSGYNDPKIWAEATLQTSCTTRLVKSVSGKPENRLTSKPLTSRSYYVRSHSICTLVHVELKSHCIHPIHNLVYNSIKSFSNIKKGPSVMAVFSMKAVNLEGHLTYDLHMFYQGRDLPDYNGSVIFSVSTFESCTPLSYFCSGSLSRQSVLQLSHRYYFCFMTYAYITYTYRI